MLDFKTLEPKNNTKKILATFPSHIKINIAATLRSPKIKIKQSDIEVAHKEGPLKVSNF